MFQQALIVPLRGRLAAVVTVRLPRAGGEIAEQRRLTASGPRALVRIVRHGRRRETGAAYLVDSS